MSEKAGFTVFFDRAVFILYTDDLKDTPKMRISSQNNAMKFVFAWSS